MATEEFESWNHDQNEKTTISAYYVDENAIGDLDITIVSGNKFSNNLNANTNRIILNEKALSALQLGDAVTAVGRTFNLNDSMRYTVSGVVKDFHFQNFKRPIAPMAFLYSHDVLNILNLKVHPGKTDIVKQRLESLDIQKEIGSKVDYFFWDKVYRDLQGHNEDILTVVFLTITLVVIGSIGLIGVLTYSVEQRRKEVTLRKIIGASFHQIFLLLTKEYIILLCISVAIGAPIGYFVAVQFLDDFAYRVELNIWFLLLPITLLVAIGGAILFFTTIKSCLVPPVNNLRY